MKAINDWTCSTRDSWGVGKTLSESTTWHLWKYIRIRSMLNCVLKKLKAIMRAGSIWVRISLEDPRKHRNESLLFEEAGKFSSIWQGTNFAKANFVLYINDTCWPSRLTWKRKGDGRMRRNRMRQWPTLKYYPKNSKKTPGRSKKFEPEWLASILRIGLCSS